MMSVTASAASVAKPSAWCHLSSAWRRWTLRSSLAMRSFSAASSGPVLLFSWNRSKFMSAPDGAGEGVDADGGLDGLARGVTGADGAGVDGTATPAGVAGVGEGCGCWASATAPSSMRTQRERIARIIASYVWRGG